MHVQLRLVKQVARPLNYFLFKPTLNNRLKASDLKQTVNSCEQRAKHDYEKAQPDEDQRRIENIRAEEPEKNSPSVESAAEGLRHSGDDHHR